APPIARWKSSPSWKISQSTSPKHATSTLIGKPRVSFHHFVHDRQELVPFRRRSIAHSSGDGAHVGRNDARSAAARLANEAAFRDIEGRRTVRRARLSAANAGLEIDRVADRGEEL